MKKIILILAVVCAAGIVKVQAQEYQLAVGARGAGNSSGISVKYNFDPDNSVEAILGFQHGFNVFALYERNVPVIGRGFYFYYGLGGNVGSWKDDGEDDLTIGVDAIVGLEYVIPNAPIALSIDYKPILNITGHTGFQATDFGFTAKFIF